MADAMFHLDVLTDYAARLLTAGGFGATDARTTAELLVWANLRGAESHGLLRIPRYIEMVETGLIDPAGMPDIVSETAAVAVVDAHLAPAATSMALACDTAVRIGRGMGIGLCVIRRTTHAGAIGYFVHRIAAAGLVGIVMTASKPLMAYVGAQGEAISTNPLAIGVPSTDPAAPLVLDMSTAAVALGKLMAARDAGKPIPEGWAVDAEGRATTDPAKAKALLPMAGAKGAGLSLMIEVLASLLSGNPLIAPALAGSDPAGFNGLVIAIDPAAFGDSARFLADVGALAAAIGGLQPAPGVEAVLLPGERGRRMAAQRCEHGIPLVPGTATKLAELAARFGIAVPEPMTTTREH